MVKLPRQATNEQILEVIGAWVELLAQDRYEEAIQMLRHTSTSNWSPELIKTVISNYGFIEPRKDEKVFHVTSLKKNPAGNPFQEIEWYGDDPNRPQEYLGMVGYKFIGKKNLTYSIT
jgi:hypothetical protein